MITTPFRHERPAELSDALALLAQAGAEARVLSGGTWLVPEMVRGEQHPTCVVDLRALGLEPIRREGDLVVLAATATYRDVLDSELVAAELPLLHQMASGVTGGAQLLNLATLAGSCCQALPSSDAPGCLAALDARMRIASAEGTREIGWSDFFRGAFQTALEPGELLLEIALPVRGELPRGYVKLKHSDGSWPIATAACQLTAQERVRLVLGAIGPVPIAIEGARGDDWKQLVADAVAGLAEPWDDVLADAGYRRRIAPVAARRALAQAGVS